MLRSQHDWYEQQEEHDQSEGEESDATIRSEDVFQGDDGVTYEVVRIDHEESYVEARPYDNQGSELINFDLEYCKCA